MTAKSLMSRWPRWLYCNIYDYLKIGVLWSDKIDPDTILSPEVRERAQPELLQILEHQEEICSYVGHEVQFR